MNIQEEYEKCKNSMAYWAEKYCVIHTYEGDRKFNERELAEIRQIEELKKAGYNLSGVRWYRKGYRFILEQTMPTDKT